MKGAIVERAGRPPVFGEFREPDPGPDETVIEVMAASISPLTRARATGAHYSSRTDPPFVPGVDGVGRTPEGRRVYFTFPRAPFGTMAERSLARRGAYVGLPAGLDPETAAAAANPALSCWLPLTRRARPHPGESVLVHGATGAAGRLAIQVAKHLGAASVVATGRDPKKLDTLRALGADVTLPLDAPPATLTESVRREVRERRIGVVLDYLWGPSAEALLAAFAGPDAPRGVTPVRYVQVGSLGGPTLSLPSEWLRSSGLEILGTGIGSSSDEEIVSGIGEFFRAYGPAKFRVAYRTYPLAEVDRAWAAAGETDRPVLRIASGSPGDRSDR